MPYTKPVISHAAAIPESDRIAKQVCNDMYVTTVYGPTCLVDGGVVPPAQSQSGGDAGAYGTGTGTTTKVKILVPVTPGGPIPYVEVGTVAASTTIRQTATNAISLANNPYDPATRFSQYFPPAPLPYICPERIPNNDPKGSTRECIPITRFIGSKDAPQTE